MKVLSRWINVCLYGILFFTLIAALGSIFFHQPVFLSVVRSYSMYPLFERGDLVFIERITPKDSLQSGDIIIFKTESGELSTKGWIIHRIVGGDVKDGFITQGDNNPQTDQAAGAADPVRQDWIVSRVIHIGGQPLKLPMIGYLPLWAERFQGSPYMLPGITIAVALSLGIVEWLGFKKRRSSRNKGRLSMQTIYFCSGMTISILICASMISSSQYITLNYEVSADDRAVLAGSSVGMIQIGDEVEQPLADLFVHKSRPKQEVKPLKQR